MNTKRYSPILGGRVDSTVLEYINLVRDRRAPFEARVESWTRGDFSAQITTSDATLLAFVAAFHENILEYARKGRIRIGVLQFTAHFVSDNMRYDEGQRLPFPASLTTGSGHCAHFAVASHVLMAAVGRISILHTGANHLIATTMDPETGKQLTVDATQKRSMRVRDGIFDSGVDPEYVRLVRPVGSDAQFVHNKFITK